MTPLPSSDHPRETPRAVALLLYPDCVGLDVLGPLEALALADHLSGGALYTLTTVGLDEAPLRLASRLRVLPDTTLDALPPQHTIIAPGGLLAGSSISPDSAAPISPAALALTAWLRERAAETPRVVSVCTGAFLLAHAGLLDGRRATTHWAYCDALARAFPQVEVEPDALFIQDGAVHTSAGVTAGIDLALSLITTDHSAALAHEVARHLVVFLRRPGGQSQFSAYLRAGPVEDDRIRALIMWISEHLTDDLSVEALARRAAMSPRHLSRRFREATGKTPAQFVTRARVERARQLLLRADLGVEGVAAQCGFSSAELLRRAFHRTHGVSPDAWRARFGLG